MREETRSAEGEWVQYRVDVTNFFALGIFFEKSDGSSSWRHSGIEPIPLHRSFLNQTIACFTLFHSMRRSENGSKNNKICYLQVQRVPKVVKLIEVMNTLNKEYKRWFKELTQTAGASKPGSQSDRLVLLFK